MWILMTDNKYIMVNNAVCRTNAPIIHWLGAYSTYALYCYLEDVFAFPSWIVLAFVIIIFLFWFKPLRKGVSLIYSFIMAVFWDG